MTAISTNLRRLKAAGRPQLPGDVFAMLLPSEMYLFGRVILVDPPRQTAPGPGVILVYIYRHQSKAKDLNGAIPRPDDLLIPPVWTNRLGWTKGYFETIDSVPLQPSDLHRRHCFRRYDGVCLDEQGRRLTECTEPCGVWGLVSYRWIDDHISDALGIPRVP
jgi:hypothetical protein